MPIKQWSKEKRIGVGQHLVRTLSVPVNKTNEAQQYLSNVLPSHYASPELIAKTLEKFGKFAVAKLLSTKLPTRRSSQSGDLGEIIATEVVKEYTDFEVPINRLRWKDHKNMSVRGEDVIGIKRPKGRFKMRFLKGEVKSRSNLTNAVVRKARKALDLNDGLPSAHALAFLAERLLETGQEELSDEISKANLVDGIKPGRVTHMVFAFSGNDPYQILENELRQYKGSINQLSMGIHINNHQKFIQEVFSAMEDKDEH